MANKWLDSFRSAIRILQRNPGLTIVAVLALTVGIGANTAVFSVLDAVLLRPLPFADADRLVSVAADLRGLNMPNVGISVPEYEDLRDRAGIFEALSFVWPMDGNLTGVNRPERVEALAVDANYFDLLGTSARLGRTFRPSDVRPGVSEAVVLSDGVWKRAFGADANILGRKLYLDYDTFVVIGVMPPGFRHPGSTLQGDVEFWITGGFGGPPWGAKDRRTERRLRGAIAKLNRGISIDAARSRLNAYSASLRRDFPGDYSAQTEWTPRIAPLQEELAGKNNARLLAVMLAAVGLVLLICCATVAHLLLAKGVARSGEFAVRAALGASRGDLLRQLACESLIVSCAGGVLGLLLSAAMTPGIAELAPIHLPRVNRPVVNTTLLIFTILAAVGSALLSGLAPAWQACKVDLLTNLRGAGRSASVNTSRHRLQTVLVAGQVAISLVLMIGCGLLSKSVWNLLRADPGFVTKNVLVASIWLPPPTNPQADRKYLNPDRRSSFVRELMHQASTLPGIEAVAMGAGSSIPLTGWNAGRFSLEDATVSRGEPLTAAMTSVTPQFFRVLRIPLIEGRVFAEDDDSAHRRICLIDRAMARRFFPNSTPLGRRIYQGPAGRVEPYVIAGIVGDVKTDTFDAPDAPHIYFSIYQRSDLAMTVFLRGTRDPAGLADALHRKVRGIDPDLPIFGVRTMDQVVAASMAQRRFALQVIGAFAVLALTLSLLGIYGVISFGLNERRREIGIRMALGAQPRQLLSGVLIRGLRMVAWGLPIGLAGSVLLARSLESLLFGATSTDPATYAGVSCVLVVAALISCYVPARKALGADPAGALRAE
ncbi:ABC transporter permease [uncultured Paludibaculum sp.]|uniref:ABC transporter permease n=1 Tax=uncultured Paludibaculum sp. TaxID=1765020 RepID=UPI002AAB5311|nr:ABC transporter permease [uncultured Paludibaculum sp.]